MTSLDAQPPGPGARAAVRNRLMAAGLPGEAAFITGAALPIDGGAAAWPQLPLVSAKE